MTETRPHALITGASSGIGAALAREFAQAGYDPILAARRRQPMESLAEELGGLGADSTVLPADLGQSGGADELMAMLDSRGLAVDVLVNNAGLGDSKPVIQADPARLRSQIQVNVTALTALARGLAPYMIERGRGGILNVASLAGFMPGPEMAVYHATKAYAVTFSQALSYELRGTGVTVTALCPGPVHTEFAQEAEMQSSWLFRMPGAAMTPAPVARAGYRGFARGKPVVVPGVTNKVNVFLARHLPRGLAMPLAAAVLKAR